MKTRKTTIESREETLKDIERGYGEKVAKALERYCKIKGFDVDDVVSDMSEDGNGMTAWDKFDIWAQKTQKLDIMGNFDDTYDWTGADADREREKEIADAEKDEKRKARNSARRELKKKSRAEHGLREYAIDDFDKVLESSRCRDQEILDGVGQYLSDCEWVGDMTYDDYEPVLEIELDDGSRYEIKVNKIG